MEVSLVLRVKLIIKYKGRHEKSPNEKSPNEESPNTKSPNLSKYEESPNYEKS